MSAQATADLILGVTILMPLTVCLVVVAVTWTLEDLAAWSEARAKRGRGGALQQFWPVAYRRRSRVGYRTASRGGDVAVQQLRSVRRRRPGDLLILATLALSVLVAAESTARVRAGDIEAAFLAFLAIHAMSDDTMLLIDQLTKMGMP
jgi:hypothetical protein